MNDVIQEQIKFLNNLYFPVIRKILNKNSYLFTKFIEATPKQDMEEGFDSIFMFPDVKIPIRIRKNCFLKYRDVTIRSKSGYGNPTEIDKIRAGCGDYYFYGWENEKRTNIFCYTIFDLKKFVNTGVIDFPTDSDIPNGDGTFFNSYSLESLIKEDVVILYEKL